MSGKLCSRNMCSSKLWGIEAVGEKGSKINYMDDINEDTEVDKGGEDILNLWDDPRSVLVSP